MMDKASIKKIGNWVVSVFDAHERMNELFTYDEKMKLVDKITDMMDRADFNLYAQELTEQNNKKANDLSSNLSEIDMFLKAMTQNFVKLNKDVSHDQRSLNASFIIGLFFDFLEFLLQAITHIRKTSVLSIVSEIDIRKTINELNEIDQQLNEFVAYNDLHSFHEADVYPVDIIERAREQLNRISLNYGKKNSDEMNNNGKNEIEEIIEFPVDIFMKQENYMLFIYLADKYAKGKRPVDLSHIFRWMEEKNLTAKRAGKKYMDYCVENKLAVGKFARMADPDSKTRTPLNELQKVFNQSRVKTSK